MLYGYAGKILWVDLSTGALRDEPTPAGIARDFIGGYGMAARILYDLIPAGADPLGPENVLAVLTGPLTASGAPTGTRWTVACKSPLTGGWGDANGSGFFGPALKLAGYDAVFFTGISAQPVYLLIDAGVPALLPAGDWWGLDTYELEDAVKAKYGKKAEAACIGPAGEKLSLISGVVTAKGRIAARSGVGAVMGSKRVKAVVAVAGSGGIPVPDAEALKTVRDKYVKQINDGTGAANFYKTTGTPGYTAFGVVVADSPIRNWSESPDAFPDPNKVGHEALFALGRKKRTCWHCPIGCWGEIPLDGGPDAAHQPEYETGAAFGSNLLVDDVRMLLKSNDGCNRLGLDTISAGATIAFAMECYEAGLIGPKDTGGLALKWGDGETVLEVLDAMGRREGPLGELLADGTRRAAAKIGGNALDYAVEIGGQELPMHDPRYEPGLALIYQMDATPGRHTQACQYAGGPAEWDATEGFPGFGQQREKQVGRGHYMKPFSHLAHVMNVSGLCLFGYCSTTATLLSEFLSAVTGQPYDMATVMQCGERIANMRHTFNLKHGYNPLDQRIPWRAFGRPPLERGPTAGFTVDIDTLRREYLEDMDWSQDRALPSAAKLRELGLEDLVADIYS
ncbi:MAG: aldehyde ferredoxin oxidoreductase family protein [Anaerolineae bacterium]|nr:aldehyde ferredoxin oxidoreductase family protein [Anaerolineae bacterium]